MIYLLINSDKLVDNGHKPVYHVSHAVPINSKSGD